MVRWFGMGNYADAKWSQRRYIVVEGTVEGFPSQNMGFAVDWRRMFRVSSVCGNRRSQRWRGTSIATPARIAKKWASNVRIACPAAFLLWTSGGTSW